MEHAILPRMSTYRVLHHDCIRTHLHPLSTICDPICTIPCNPTYRGTNTLEHADNQLVHSMQCPPMHLP